MIALQKGLGKRKNLVFYKNRDILLINFFKLEVKLYVKTIYRISFNRLFVEPDNFSLPVKAQLETKKEAGTQTLKTDNQTPKTDLKQVFAKEVEKSQNSDSFTSINFKKIKNEQSNSAISKKKWSKKKKFWVTMAIIGAAVGIVLLAIYAKPCPEGQDYECESDVFTDELDCVCVPE
jgi:hypothetical protein